MICLQNNLLVGRLGKNVGVDQIIFLCQGQFFIHLVLSSGCDALRKASVSSLDHRTT